MPSIYHEADCIAATGERLLFGVSLGRDTVCFLHLLSSRLNLSDHVFVHHTMYDTMLPYQARYLSYLEKRYGFQALVRPDPRTQAMGFRNVSEERDLLLDQYGCSLMVLGYRMDESLQRRGMLKSLTDGINRKLRECYPVRAWTSRITDTYVRTNRIILAPEYKYGLRDCRNHRGVKAWVLRHLISEEDYQAAIAQDPLVEIDYVRYEKLARADILAEIRDSKD